MHVPHVGLFPKKGKDLGIEVYIKRKYYNAWEIWWVVEGIKETFKGYLTVIWKKEKHIQVGGACEKRFEHIKS